MRLPILCLLVALGLFAACKDGGKSSSAAHAAATHTTLAPKTDLDKKQTDELLNMLSAYYSLKDALVASSGAKADEAASKLLSAAEMFRNEVTSAPQGTEIKPKLEDIMSGCDSVIATKADSLEQKRVYFSGISEAIYKTLKIANLKNGGVYHQYCPMALSDKGAYWLSTEEEIKNPYFGKRMLECGEVKDSL